MNKNIGIQKIKVNNGQELITEAKKWKNSGGEWKLLEKYWTSPGGSGGKNTNKKHAKWGIIISDGKREIDIYSDKVKDWENGGEGVLVNRLDEVDTRDELHQFFPEAKFAYFAGDDSEHDKYGGRPLQSRLDFNTYKSIKDAAGEYDLIRYLVAENSWHLKQILLQYVLENEAKIYQSTNPHFSGWIEIIDGQDGNIYLYVGEKNAGGGREIKIGIQKNEFENCKRDSGDSPHKALEDYWGLFTIDRPKTPAETHEYYSKTGGLEQEWQRNWPHRQGLCRRYLEELRGLMTDKANYWQEKTRQKEYWDHEANEQSLLAHSHVAEIDAHLANMKKNRPAYYAACDKDCDICGIKLCCHYEGQACSENKKALFSNFDDDCRMSGLERNWDTNFINYQLTDTEKQQILQYLIKNGLSKISLENGKLVIEYNNNNKKIVETEDQEQQKYHQIIEKLSSQSLSLSELQNNNTNHPSTPNKNNIGIYIGLTIGAFILGGILVYFLVRKRKNSGI